MTIATVGKAVPETTVGAAAPCRSTPDSASCRWLRHYRRGLPARRPAHAPTSSAGVERRGRIEEWSRELQPSNLLERELTECVAHLSWTLEQAQRAEAAVLSRQSSDAAHREAAKAEILGRRLLGELPPSRSRAGRKGGGADLPAVLLRRLERTAEGCRWLLARWDEFATVVASGGPIGNADLYRLIRLLGKEPLDAVYDVEVHRILVACDAHRPRMGQDFFEACRARVPQEDPAFRDQRTWRNLIDPDAKPREETLGASLLELIAFQSNRLKTAIQRHESSDERSGVDSAAMCPSRRLERLQRLQASQSRELRQVVDLLRKVRAVRPGREKADPPILADAPPSPTEPVRPVAPEPSSVSQGAPRPDARQAAIGARPHASRRPPVQCERRREPRRVGAQPQGSAGTPTVRPHPLRKPGPRRVRSPAAV